jgi:hypothetical protein
MPKCERVLKKLQTLTDGLLMMSESDYPFEIIEGVGELKPDKELTLDEFFCNCTTHQDWHNEEEAAEVIRFQELVSFLKDNLEDVKVYLCGECEIDVYIIGNMNGDLVGLRTKVVRT